VLRAVVLTQGQTDGQTDGIAVDSTALAMRALRRAVKILLNDVPSKRNLIGAKTALVLTGQTALCHDMPS